MILIVQEPFKSDEQGFDKNPRINYEIIFVNDQNSYQITKNSDEIIRLGSVD